MRRLSLLSIVAMRCGMALMLAGLSSVALAQSVADKTLLSKVSARLGADTVLDRHFVQEKQLKVLKRPLRTEGTLLYRREFGVCWHTQLPVVSTLVLGEQQLRQINGTDEMVLQADQQPALFGFTRLFFAALAGQVQTLAEHFDLLVSGDEQHWQLELTPRDALLQKFIVHMQLTGGAQVDRVQVSGREGDLTTIEFSPLDSAATAVVPELEHTCFVR